MPLYAETVGLKTRSWQGVADARWLMAYAAGLGHTESIYLDTTRAAGIAPHPMFSIAPEWGLLTDSDNGLDVGLTLLEAARGVHASHDLELHTPIRPGTELTVDAEVVGIESIAPGGLLTMRFIGTAADGPRLWTSWMGAVYRGVEVVGEAPADRVTAPPPAPVPVMSGTPRESEIELAVNAPHIYAECARLWNPIHTDMTVARSAGLESIILHGSATLAHGVDWALEVLGAEPQRALRLGASLRGMVGVPGALRRVVTGVAELGGGSRIASFEVRTEHGVAVRDAFLVVGSGEQGGENA